METRFVMFKTDNGKGEIWINPAAVRAVQQRNPRATSLHFDDTHTLLVDGQVEETVRRLQSGTA